MTNEERLLVNVGDVLYGSFQYDMPDVIVPLMVIATEDRTEYDHSSENMLDYREIWVIGRTNCGDVGVFRLWSWAAFRTKQEAVNHVLEERQKKSMWEKEFARERVRQVVEKLERKAEAEQKIKGLELCGYFDHSNDKKWYEKFFNF